MLLEAGGRKITNKESEGRCRGVWGMALRIEWDCGKGGCC